MAHKVSKIVPRERSDKLIHDIRFNHLGFSQLKIAENLSIDGRTWRYLRRGKRSFSLDLAGRIEIMISVHRQTSEILHGSALSKAMATSVKRADSLDELKGNFDEIRSLLEEQFAAQDYGLVGLCGAVSFAIWKLASNLSNGKDREYADRRLLDTAIECWEKAADLAPKMASKTFAINARTAKIYKEVYFMSEKPEAKPSLDNYMAYRAYAETANSVQAWRDALEQAALLGRPEEIRRDFSELRRVLQNSPISPVDAYEVVLTELREIDGAPVLVSEPVFLEWVAEITRQYEELRNKGIAA